MRKTRFGSLRLGRSPGEGNVYSFQYSYLRNSRDKGAWLGRKVSNMTEWITLIYLSTPLQYSCLENSMDGGAWKAAFHGVAEGRTRLSDFTFTFHFHALEKEMATHSSVLAWRIPGTVEHGGLPSMGSHRVGHDWSDLALAAASKERGLSIISLIQIPKLL